MEGPARLVIPRYGKGNLLLFQSKLYEYPKKSTGQPGRRLAPSLERSWGPTKSCASSKTGTCKLCTKLLRCIYSSDSRDHCYHWSQWIIEYICSHHMNPFTSLGWMGELRSDQCLWQSTSPNFRGTGSDFPCKVYSIPRVCPSLGVEFQSFSDHRTVDPVRG